MLAFFKVKSPMLGLLAILTLQLLSIVSGSTLDFFDENEVEAPGLFGRAVGGKYVGSACTTNIDCYSENCAPTNGTTKLTCQRQPIGGPCFKNSNCLTRNCANTCHWLSLTFGVCETSRDCRTGTTCVNGICKKNNTEFCQSDRACVSGRCFKGVCRNPPSGLPEDPCEDNSECAFGTCKLDPFPGIDFAGGGLQNDDWSRYCERYPLGHSCTTSNQCADGSCKNGLCAKSQVGDDCLKPSQCPGESLCGPDKKCYIPSDRTVYSNDFCKTDEQCTSNRCSTTKVLKYQNGLNFDQTSTKTYPVCGLLDNGASGCRTFRDCLTGLCQDGTCKLGKDGDRCIANYMCETGKLCGYDGVCYTPDGPQERDAVCNDNKDCRLGNCVFYSRYRKERPSLDVPTYGVLGLDGNCDGLSLDAACSSTDDCLDSACLGGVCKKVPNGGRCTTGEQCDSAVCVDAPGGTYKTCSALFTTDAFCTENDQCFSGNCLFVCSRETNGECNYYDPTYKCEAVPPTRTCRIQADCGFGKICTEDKICKWLDYNGFCSADIECLSGFCGLSYDCLPADLATSSSGMSMTTASTSTSTTSTTSTTTSVISSTSSTTSTSASATPTISETAAPSTSSTASVEKPTSANKTSTTTTTSTTTAESTTSSVAV
ncbi:hypothetical protein CF319_g1237 [Tilletia indica]|nr:hypothetical protein CF319_g1237 [Tilletia indica]